MYVRMHCVCRDIEMYGYGWNLNRMHGGWIKDERGGRDGGGANAGYTTIH